jgi:6-phosphogluconate dehydrogenase
MMTLQQFWDRCNQFDWYYQMSDDHSVWQRGCAAESEILDLIKDGGPAFADMWNAFKAHYYSGAPWNTKQSPKPERPSV